MENEIFKDIVPDEALNDIEQELYVPWKDNGLNTQVDELRKQFATTLTKMSEVYKASLIMSDKRGLGATQRELDKIAYLTQEFVNEFKEIYELMFALYSAEKLAGTNIGGSVSIAGALTSSNVTNISYPGSITLSGGNVSNPQLSQQTLTNALTNAFASATNQIANQVIKQKVRKVKLNRKAI